MMNSLADGDCDRHFVTTFLKNLIALTPSGTRKYIYEIKDQIEPSIWNECLDCVTTPSLSQSNVYVLLIKVTKLARLNMNKMTY